ncbi:modular serine protease-like isoform X1 [Metopolophium dirhodum]|uniref:modular serine protease-like isoform X1 n=2 Tax=Metopolophium dirhodum TaxID=44670 RepID=UPI00298F5A8D|nr:modular serine protease-like isoform X1 [Metopolophium dirhodum]XP_060870479.1 modular serine protease-like isoform X1 [Metopolophium dirhodum]
MKAISSWLTLCLCFVLGTTGTGILCNPLIEKRQTESCSVNMFSCINEECIDASSICDGVADCSDKSDETQSLCAPLFKTCPGSAFRCKYGACVSKNAKCNGRKDCVDGSDEQLPECKKLGLSIPSSPTRPQQTQVASQAKCLPREEYRCTSGQCIDVTSICDGTSDCNDGSDETSELCKSRVCPTSTFTCNYGACISKQRKCDGSQQCADGSDEAGCGSNGDRKPSSSVNPTSQFTQRPTTYQTSRPTTQRTTTHANNMKSCMVPYMEGTVYSLFETESDQNPSLSPGSFVDPSTAVEESCEEGYYKTTSNRIIICSGNGKWKPKADKLCLKKCPSVFSESLDVECIFNGIKDDCSNPSIPGTVLTPKCKVTHTIPNGQIETPIKLRCQQDGKWSDRLYTCIPYCGRPYTPNQVLILDGTEAKYGSAPWNVGVYRKSTRNSFNMICGGSLIATNLVVSAAHCFWQEKLTSRILLNDGTYKVGVGKYNSDITIKDNEFTQIIDVGLIYLREGYYGSSGYHAEDLAIIVLSNKIILSNVVMPVCVDWSKRYSVLNGAVGKVVGWGKTEKMVESSVLLEANIPYIDHQTCRNMYQNGFQNFVSVDKFCAGTISGQGVHQGDSGAGFTFEHSSLHFLTGIVSVKDATTNDSIAVFTDVSRHISWIHEMYTNYTYASDSFSRSVR